MNQQRIISAVAPTRICDIGGWTDTWFAQHGAVFSIAVYPYVEVQLFLKDGGTADRVAISFENYGERHTFDVTNLTYDHHPLIQAALEVCGVPTDVSVSANIFSAVPPGASTGTSAALSVALVAGLDQLQNGSRTSHEIAATAHSLETEKLKLQSGVQDQLASAYGGINFLEITQYPHTTVSPLYVSDRIWWELENRLGLVYIGQPHSSSKIHEQVINALGSNATHDSRLEKLRRLAGDAKAAVMRGDFQALADAMNSNTAVQRSMHAGLVAPEFDRAMEIGRANGGIGFKVNGAGGDGGTLTILTDGNMARKRRLLQKLEKDGFTNIPVYLARRGVRAWRSA